MEKEYLQTRHARQTADDIRCKILVLGSSQVGKTAIIKRFVYNTFSDYYRETVEDIFSREFVIRGQSVMVDIYDSHIGYPDMRRLRMATADALVFVFSLENSDTFEQIKLLMVEAADRRKDLEVLPCVLVGNKSDKPEHQVVRNTVCKWLSQSLVPHYVPYLETSAKSGENVVEIFRTLLRLSFVMGPKQNPVTNPPLVQLAQSRANQNDNGGILVRRRSSARKRLRTDSTSDKSTEQITSLMRKFSITRHASLRLSKKRWSKSSAKETEQPECQIS